MSGRHPSPEPLRAQFRGWAVGSAHGAVAVGIPSQEIRSADATSSPPRPLGVHEAWGTRQRPFTGIGAAAARGSPIESCKFDRWRGLAPAPARQALRGESFAFEAWSTRVGGDLARRLMTAGAAFARETHQDRKHEGGARATGEITLHTEAMRLCRYRRRAHGRVLSGCARKRRAGVLPGPLQRGRDFHPERGNGPARGDRHGDGERKLRKTPLAARFPSGRRIELHGNDAEADVFMAPLGLEAQTES